MGMKKKQMGRIKKQIDCKACSPYPLSVFRDISPSSNGIGFVASFHPPPPSTHLITVSWASTHPGRHGEHLKRLALLISWQSLFLLCPFRWSRKYKSLVRQRGPLHLIYEQLLQFLVCLLMVPRHLPARYLSHTGASEIIVLPSCCLLFT